MVPTTGLVIARCGILPVSGSRLFYVGGTINSSCLLSKNVGLCHRPILEMKWTMPYACMVFITGTPLA